MTDRELRRLGMTDETIARARLLAGVPEEDLKDALKARTPDGELTIELVMKRLGLERREKRTESRLSLGFE